MKWRLLLGSLLILISLIFALGFHGNDHIDWGESASVGQGEIRTFVALDGSGN